MPHIFPVQLRDVESVDNINQSMATTEVERQSSIVSTISAWKERNQFAAVEHIHKKERHRHRREVSVERENGSHTTRRDLSASSQLAQLESLTSKASHPNYHERQDSRSVFLQYKRGKQELLKSKKTSGDFSESPHDSAVVETEATAPISPKIDPPEGTKIGLRRKMKPRLKAINRNGGWRDEAGGQEVPDPHQSSVQTVLSPVSNLKPPTHRGKSGGFSLDFGALLNQDLKQAYHQNMVEEFIAEYQETESVGKQKMSAIAKSRRTKSKLLKRFLETVEKLQDMDLYDPHVLPKIYSEKVHDEVFRSFEAKEVARDFHLAMQNPGRPTARIERCRRRLKKPTEQ